MDISIDLGGHQMPKKRDIIELSSLVTACRNVTRVKPAMFLATLRNALRTDPECLAVIEIRTKWAPIYSEYERQRIEINEQAVIRRPNGAPSVTEGAYDIDPAKADERRRAIVALQDEFRDAIQAEKDRQIEVTTILDEPWDAPSSWRRLKESDIQDGDFTAEQMAFLLHLGLLIVEVE